MRLFLIAALPLAAAPAIANDTTSQLGTGGLLFVTNENVSMDSEDLSISPDRVSVVYRFTNKGDADDNVLVAFPLPDITGDGDFMVAIPDEDEQNLFGFTTSFDGRPVKSTLHQYAFAFGVDQTELLTSLGVPLAPFGEATQTALNALSDADHDQLVHLGLVIPMQYDDGSGWKTDYTPVWTLKSTYTWEANFPAGKTVEVRHAYTPSVGGTVATTFLTPALRRDGRGSAENLQGKILHRRQPDQNAESVDDQQDRFLLHPLCRELDFLRLVHRRQLERPDRQIPPHHRQGRPQEPRLLLLGRQGQEDRPHHLRDDGRRLGAAGARSRHPAAAAPRYGELTAMGETLSELSDRLAQVSDVYAQRTGIVRDDDWYVLKLQEEAGELVAEHLRLTGRGRLRDGGKAAALAARDDEAADLFAMVVLYCRHNGIDLETALARKWFRHLESPP